MRGNTLGSDPLLPGYVCAFLRKYRDVPLEVAKSLNYDLVAGEVCCGDGGLVCFVVDFEVRAVDDYDFSLAV